MRFPMHLSMSTITDDQHHHLHHHHPRYDPHDSMAYEYAPESHPPGGGGRGVGGRPMGYALSDISSSDYTSSWRRNSRQGILLLVTFIIELLLLVFVVIVEYFLRWTDVFPLRRQNFTCTDTSISCTSRDKQLMADFAFNADVPDEAIYALSFCVPPLVVLIGEIGLCTFAEGEQKDIRLMNKHCAVPQIVRRLLRFLGVFVFGGFALMVFVDVTKIMTGRLRPDFLEACQVNETMCPLFPTLGDSACLNSDKMDIRHARTSFPSLNAALSSYAALFISVYIHGAMRSHSVRVLRPFLALVFILLALLGGLAEYSRCVSHLSDIAVGFAAGIAMSIYLTVYVLNQFQEHLSQSEMVHMMRAFIADTYLPYEDKSHLTRPSDHLSSMHIPRAHMTPVPPSRMSDAGEGKHQRRRPHNTFQRDLSQSVDYHRRHQSYLHAGSSHM
ncbi:phospholipid phosphatase-related protein type 5-like [Littorina saxatilis]|uniref:Phosphatidic acid phosphatase type 2/haloperoxidase domain-containing protein n=1 Tax=Littorina saxatilis TaxID=31220 RepID=A0AAN9B9T6_9CAEN